MWTFCWGVLYVIWALISFSRGAVHIPLKFLDKKLNKFIYKLPALSRFPCLKIQPLVMSMLALILLRILLRAKISRWWTFSINGLFAVYINFSLNCLLLCFKVSSLLSHPTSLIQWHAPATVQGSATCCEQDGCASFSFLDDQGLEVGMTQVRGRIRSIPMHVIFNPCLNSSAGRRRCN
jgi:hypothetical protein